MKVKLIPGIVHRRYRMVRPSKPKRAPRAVLPLPPSFLVLGDPRIGWLIGGPILGNVVDPGRT